MKHPFVPIILTSVLILLLCGVVYAGTTGKIKGVVKDSRTGEPLVGANILVVGTSLGAATNLEGKYFVLNVPPGRYTIRAMMIGYTTLEVEDVQVSIDLTSRLDLDLEATVLDVGEVVTVTASRRMIQMDATATATQITSEEIATAPVETVEELMATKAGVTTDAGGEIHIRGGRSNEIAYLVDGIPNMNPFTNTQGIEISTNAIAELSIISGSFNAEYGQALSGVVNIVTKEGAKDYSGSISYQGGDLLTDYDIEIDSLISEEKGSWDYSNFKELEGSLSGPIPLVSDRASFYVSGRYFDRESYLYGSRIYSTKGALLDSTFGKEAEIVPMNPFTNLNLQSKFTFRITPSVKLLYSFIRQNKEWQTYSSVTDHRRKIVPDGRLKRKEDDNTHILKLTHQLSNKSFYTLIASNYINEYDSRAFEDVNDPNYVWDGYYLRDVNYEFNTGGTQNGIIERKATINELKFDFSSQVNDEHEIKFGFDFKNLNLNQLDFSVLPDRTAEPFTDMNGNGEWDEGEDFVDENGDGIYSIAFDDNGDSLRGNITIGQGLSYNQYEHNPAEISVYFQDKIELTDMVINIGLRYDYFQPDGVVPADLQNPSQDSVLDASVKTQFSPRFSIAYPITDRGKLFFSYGRFFQLPPYTRLYQNPDLEVRSGVIATDIGNADLKPQKTVAYELGIEQQLAEDLAVYLKVFFKDYRNLLGQRRYITDTSSEYTFFINRSYADVKGMTFTLDKRFSNFFSGSVDYTYQIAQGNQSDPTASRTNYRLSIEEAKQVVFLSWDQTHALRINTHFGQRNNWGVGIIGRVESGYPYTPQGANEIVRIAEENSGRKIPILDFDLNAFKTFNLSVGDHNLRWSIYGKIYNLFDKKNEKYVWDSTGRATYSLGQYGGRLTPEFENRPYWFSQPRTLYLGAKFEF